MQGKKSVSVSFFGDGASNEGAFHEGINFAAMYKVPTLFVCENNLYGASTPVSKTVQIKDIADRAAAYGIEGVVCDGQDVFAVYETANRLIDKARNGGGPTLLELKTYRRCGHSRKDAKLYMDKEEMAYWMARDPITIAADILKEEGICTDEMLEDISNQVDDEIEASVEFAQSSPDPLPEDTFNDVFWNGEEEAK
jgi:pyruvate dehydrogenase E1 component alpha subunit